MNEQMYCLRCLEWVESDGEDHFGEEYHLVSAGMENGVRVPCGPLFDSASAAIQHLRQMIAELVEANGELCRKLYLREEETQP